MLHLEAYTILNAALDGTSLLLGGRLAGLSTPSPKRLSLAMLIGALAALPSLREALLAAPLLLTALTSGVALCYGKHGKAACFRAAFMTLMAAMLSGGCASVLSRMGSAAPLGWSAAISLALCPLLKLLPTALTAVRQVELQRDGMAVLLPAMLDSGNLLRDPITGLPVLVVSERALTPLFAKGTVLRATAELPAGFRLLRVRTAAGSAMMPMFRPEVCRIYLDGERMEVEALVAVASEAYEGVQALVPLAVLRQGA